MALSLSAALPCALPNRARPPRRAATLQRAATNRQKLAASSQHGSQAGDEAISPSKLPLPLQRRHMLLQGCMLGAANAAIASPPANAESGDWSSPGLGAPEDPTMPKFVKLDSGVRYQILNEGKGGEGAAAGDSVEFDYVLRRANGYFIYSTVDGVSFQPKDLPTGPVEFRLGTGRMVPGIEEALTGMQEGGRRRVLIPPSVGYDPDVKLEPVPPGFAARRQVINHRSEPLIFEIELLKIRSSTG